MFAVGRKVDASSLLEKLHWLPVKKRIIFKVLLYVHKALNNSAPSYLSQCFTLYHPSHQLRSSEDKTLLCIPRELPLEKRTLTLLLHMHGMNCPETLDLLHQLLPLRDFKTSFVLICLLSYSCFSFMLRL